MRSWSSTHFTASCATTPRKNGALRRQVGLALVGLALSASLHLDAARGQNTSGPPDHGVNRPELQSYEGQHVSLVELAGRPDLNAEQLVSLIPLQAGDVLSAAKIEDAISVLKRTAQSEGVQFDLRRELDGVHVIFIPQPAVYFGMYQFTGAERFPYTRLVQVANYTAEDPYSASFVTEGRNNLELHFRRNGYFKAEVRAEVQIDKANGLANVNFHTTLGPLARFGNVVIEGTTPEQTSQLQNALRSFRARLKGSAIRPGRKYSLNTLQKATRLLESRLAKKKHLDAQVKLMAANYDSKTNRADITFSVQPGPIVHVDVGGAQLSSGTRRRLLPVYQQIGLTPEVIEQGERNLQNHFRQRGYFDVQIDTQVRENEGEQIIFYQISKGPRKRIKEIEFTGNVHFSSEELQRHAAAEEAHFTRRGRYDDESITLLTSFYQSKGFNQVKVTPTFKTVGGRHVVVTFVVDEGPQSLVADLLIKGNTIPITELAPNGVRLGPGQPYSQEFVAEDRDQIMSHYLDRGYLTAAFRSTAEPLPSDPHKFQVVYDITEGPQVRTSNIVTLGRNHTEQALVDRDTSALRPGELLTETEIFGTENRLYAHGIFDWAQVNTRSRITSQEHETVIVKVHEARRNTIRYGVGFELTNRGGNVPGGTIAVPGLPSFRVPSGFETNQETFAAPRVNFQYTRDNVRGKAQSVSFGALYGPLERRAQFDFIDPHFRWTDWRAILEITGDYNKQNPLFTSFQAGAGFQLRRALDKKKTQNLLLGYSLSRVNLTNLAIPQLVAPKDQDTRLSTFSAVYTRDTRDNPVDAHKGMYGNVEVDANPRILGSSTTFGRILGQAAYYRDLKSGFVWANSLRAGVLVPTAGDEIPLSQKFFTGGGNTLRGFPLNGAGPQRIVPACSNPSDLSTCSLIEVPTGGVQLLIINSEFRVPVPIKKGLSFATFYDGGNVFDPASPPNSNNNYTNSVGLGFRYATPVGPIRIDVGRNLNPVPGIRATQIFITIGQAF
jgi:outer membrane protein insertion porin family